MNADYQSKAPLPRQRAPLFESPWIALFLVLKKEWVQYRSQTQEQAVSTKRATTDSCEIAGKAGSHKSIAAIGRAYNTNQTESRKSIPAMGRSCNAA